MLKDKPFLRFLAVFFGIFLLLYFGALWLSGLAVPGGSYSSFVDHYLDIAAWMRSALIGSAKWFLSFWGTATFREDEYILRSDSGKAIRLVYSCLGFGVMSFWAAYAIASAGSIKRKAAWLFGGLLLIFLINALRIALVLQAAEKGKRFPFGWDHHTWFNITAYFLILLLIFLHHRFSEKMEHKRSSLRKDEWEHG
jgi:exosortase/archaeosortase family protein